MLSTMPPILCSFIIQLLFFILFVLFRLFCILLSCLFKWVMRVEEKKKTDEKYEPVER